MNSKEIRVKFLEFYRNRKHKIISPSPLVLESDPTTLFTSSGMQQLVPFLKGEQKHPEGNKLVNSQPSLRLQDIEEVGDNRHTTFFEMLGNWSLGDYFKEKQLPWVWEFFTKELGFPAEKLHISVFGGLPDQAGSKEVPRDTESFNIWKSLGVPEERIYFYGVDKNWWSRSGTPEKMPAGEIGGPDSEIFYDFGQDLKLHENSPFRNEKCHPNCDCGRFLEIGNSVFMQYKKNKDGSLTELPQRNVDFGGGLERIAAAIKGNPDVFQIDLFKRIIEEIEHTSGKKYDETSKPAMRIIADHLKAATFLISNGVIPSNKSHGYVLRRFLRRAAVKMHSLKGGLTPVPGFQAICESVIFTYDDGVYLSLEKDRGNVFKIIDEELGKFQKSLDRGLREIQKIERIDGKKAFDLYQSYGFPLEITKELFEEKGQQIDDEEFKNEFEKHKELSRSASSGMFKGGLGEVTEETTKLHTATHLLHAALRKILGEHVSQKGSNITPERLRFDFSHGEKLTAEEISKIENLINEQIKKDLPVSWEEKTLDEAMKEGALAFFGERYGKRVKVYTIGLPQGNWFSKEVCGGPHVSSTSKVGHVRIIKEEAVSSGVRRIYAAIGKP